MKRSPFDTLQLQYNHYKIKFTVEIYFTPSLSVTAVFKLKNELVAIGYNSFFWKRTTLSCLRKRFRNGRYIHLLNYTQNKGRTKLTGSLVNVANFKARFSPIFFNVVYKGNICIIPKATIGFWLTRNEEVIINSNIFYYQIPVRKSHFNRRFQRLRCMRKTRNQILSTAFRESARISRRNIRENTHTTQRLGSHNI